MHLNLPKLLLPNQRKLCPWLGLGVLLLASLACGYKLAGKADALPRELNVIAIPAFENRTPWMRLEQKLTAAVMEEFLARSRYHVVGEAEAGDAVLSGIVHAVESAPVIFDPDTGRATHVLITVRVSVTLRDPRSQKLLYQEPRFVFREQYEITGDLASFFEERSPALDRLARDFAATLVSAILENF
ncbi:MAG: LPS assembly lipoprotein LptE [Terriglobia bacterium]